jgi:hypothetical protein
MKVILSRKGFDSAVGGFASPILADGSLISLPIPATDPREDYRIHYSELHYDSNRTILDLLKSMNGMEIKAKGKWKNAGLCSAHLDPDLRFESYSRRTDWRGLFGIDGKSQSNIDKNFGVDGEDGVDIGDLFLFFGWFEEYKQKGNSLVNEENRKDFPSGRHVIFGYLQVGEILPIWRMEKTDKRILSWMDYHQHIAENRRLVGDDYFGKNTLYVATERLTFAPEQHGFGVFRYTDKSAERLVLTKKGQTRTRWELPEAFITPRKVKISWNPNGWETWAKNGYFQSSHRGQEFVVQETPQIREWAESLVQELWR